ncbi:hypothetical protein BT69DRAFT_1241087, partial [Atractiella rhizophila]
MASGTAFHGGPSRCFPVWQDFQKCYLKAEKPSDCVGYKEDYYECLFHTKEIERNRAIQKEYLRQLEEK